MHFVFVLLVLCVNSVLVRTNDAQEYGYNEYDNFDPKCTLLKRPPTGKPSTEPSTTTALYDVYPNIYGDVKSDSQFNVNSGVCEPSITTVSGPYVPSGVICRNQIIFNEEFTEFNLKIWEHLHEMFGPNRNQYQWYTNSSENSFVQNGRLHIMPSLTSDAIGDITNCQISIPECDAASTCMHACSENYPAPPVRSAYIHTNATFGFKYGRIQIRAKLPTGNWLLPTIRLMPMYNKYGDGPESGRINLLESIGNPSLTNQYHQNIGVEMFSGSLYYGLDSVYGNLPIDVFKKSRPRHGWNAQFHDYEIAWTPTHFNFTVDGEHVGTIDTADGYYKRGFHRGRNPWIDGNADAPFDEEFSLAINVAVGVGVGHDLECLDMYKFMKRCYSRSKYPVKDFWDSREYWLKTWDFEGRFIDETDEEPSGSWNVERRELSFQIDHIRIYAL